MKTKELFLALVLLLILPGIGQATLIVRGTGTIVSGGQDNGGQYQLIYDTDLDITWLDYTRYYLGGEHMDWISVLEVSFNGQIFDEWRLPEASPVNGSEYNYDWAYDGSTDEGYNISALDSPFPGSTENEMAHLYYNSLGNLGYYDINQNTPSNWGLQNTSPFQNLHPYVYSTGSLYTTPRFGFWVFDFYNGQQRNGGFGNRYAFTVLSGDVAPVPEPSTLLLLCSGIVGFAGFRRKFRHK